MVNISKKVLSKDTERRLIKQLGALIVAQQSVRNSENLLYELFTPSERILFIKRVGIITLLQKGYSAYTISCVLYVSETTVALIAEKLENGTYKNIVETLKRKEYRKSIVGILESLLTLGMPGEANRRIKTKIKEDIQAWKSGAC